MPTLTISSLGAPDVQVTVPDSDTTLDALVQAVALATGFPPDRLRLIHASTSTPLTADGAVGAPTPPVADGDTLLAVALPRAPQPTTKVVLGPSARVRRPGEEEDEDEEDEHLFRVRLPTTRPWAASAGRALLDAGAPEAFVAILLHQRTLRALQYVGLWAAGAKVASLVSPELGSLYLILSLPVLIYCNLGRRRPGEASGYALFNEGYRELPGTLNAGRLDEAIRRGG